MAELVDLNEEMLTTLDVLIRQKEFVAKSYNKKVKSNFFPIEDYVWKAILLMDRRDKTLGKQSPNWEVSFKINQVFSNNVYEIEELSLVVEYYE